MRKLIGTATATLVAILFGSALAAPGRDSATHDHTALGGSGGVSLGASVTNGSWLAAQRDALARARRDAANAIGGGTYTDPKTGLRVGGV